MGRRKWSKNKSSKNTSKTLSLVTRPLECIWDLERLWFFWIVSCIDCTSSCIEWDVWKTWILEVVVVGGIYSPNHQTNRWGGCLSMGTPDSPVHQPRHPTVRVLTVSTVGALTSWGTGQSGAAPDRHCSLSGALLALLWLCANCPRTVHVCRRPLELTVALDSRCSAGTPDSPVTHRTVRWIIVERLSKNPKVKSLSRSPLVHRTVWCARPGFSSVSFAPLFWTLTWNFLLVCVEPLAPVEYTI
jgi:hypothetical protein